MIELLQAYRPTPDEIAFIPRFLELLKVSPKCLYRHYFKPGHITGSGLLISRDGKRVLLNLHKSLNKWLCFGGHCDGESDILNVAQRELLEESGISGAEPLAPGIHDIDIHTIPANPEKNEPAHEHFDVRFIFRAWNDEFAISDESLGLKWCDFDEALALVNSEGMKRLIGKARQ